MTTNPEQHAAGTRSVAERLLDGAGPNFRVGGPLGNAVEEVEQVELQLVFSPVQWG